QFPGTVTFTLNGQTIHTAYVSASPSTVSFTYTPSSSGSGTVTATVTDSVLYSGSSSQGLNFTMPAPVVASGITGFTAIINGSNVNFNWSGGTPSYVVYRSDNNNTLCTTSVGNCPAPVSQAPHNTPVTVKDSSGNTATTTVN
ncbi:MAG TPA: hypothetical protein VH234_00660, partial [Candidatus Saccharimonadales bacterium]|nr:hypothetical protein [Candidatus Saccharimonadales bacterium]